jgi:hypothetical protein
VRVARHPAAHQPQRPLQHRLRPRHHRLRQETHQALQASGSQLLHEAYSPPIFTQRYGKTQLGRLIDSPFICTGSDTVVLKPLTPLLRLHCVIAAAPNHSTFTFTLQILPEGQANLDAMGW